MNQQNADCDCAIIRFWRRVKTGEAVRICGLCYERPAVAVLSLTGPLANLIVPTDICGDCEFVVIEHCMTIARFVR